MTDDRDVIPLSRFHSVATRPRGAQRLAEILAAPDAPARVAALPVQDLFFLIEDVGLADAEDVLALATPEQIQGCLDLAAWDRERVDENKLAPWLRALVALDPERLARVWSSLDPELTSLALKRWTRVYNLAEEDVPETEEPPFYPTPDRFFLVKITASDEDVVRLVEQLLDRLYRADPALARHALRASSSETFADLEELCLRWRSGRMQDLGYADYEEALEVYQPLDPDGVELGEETAEPPVVDESPPSLAVAPALAQPFLGRVLGEIVDAAEARRLEAALALLANRVLSADRVEPGDAVAAADGARRAAATLSLGLETVARGHVGRGVEALGRIALTRLHRVGYGVTLQLTRLASVLGARAARAEEPYASLVASLGGRRPSFPRALDEPPAPGTRPFASVADVRAATRALAILAAQITVVFDLVGADPASLGAGITIGTVGRTAIVHAALGRGVSAASVTRADVRAFAALPDGAARAESALREAAAARGVALPQEFPAAISGWTSDLGAGSSAKPGLLFE